MSAPKPTPPPNPLRILCDQLGVTPAFLARDMGIPILRAAAALSNPLRNKSVIEYIAVLQHLGVKMRLPADAPVKFWIANREIDRLVVDNAWRAKVEMCPCPRNAQGLDKICRTLKDRGMVYSEIAAYLKRHFIPTGSASRGWTDNAVKMRIAPTKVKRRGTSTQPVRFDAETWREQWRDQWRQHVVGLLLARIFPVDPTAFLRWGISARSEAKYTIIESAGPVPACAKRWLETGIRNIDWFGGHAWGIGGPPTYT